MTSDEKLTPEEIVGKNVRRLRALRDLTQEELAHEADMHRTYIGGIERAERNITLRALFALAEALEVDPRKLLVPPDEFEYP